MFSKNKSILSVATRNGWKMETQKDFRISLKGFKSNDKPLIKPSNNGSNKAF